MQTCPGFPLKSLLESPGNLLEICSAKFVDTLDATRRAVRWCQPSVLLIINPDRFSREGKAISINRPSVRPSVCLFAIYLLIRLNFELWFFLRLKLGVIG